METTMTQDLTPTTVTSRAALAARTRDVLLFVKSAVRAWINRRQAMAMLAQMDGRMLSDIGLSRGDVRSALAEPLWSDPTVRLRLLAVERRASARAAAREQLELLAKADDEAASKRPQPVKIAC
jgi:uncharacterized protein YjiS (DUF1127 family)